MEGEAIAETAPDPDSATPVDVETSPTDPFVAQEKDPDGTR